MPQTNAELAKSLETRIAAIEKRQREASTAAGKKAEQIYRMRESLVELDKQRAAKVKELHAAQKREAAAAAPPVAEHEPPVPPPAHAHPGTMLVPHSGAALASSGASVGGASTSTDTTTPRMPRVLLGVCMPHFAPSLSRPHRTSFKGGCPLRGRSHR